MDEKPQTVRLAYYGISPWEIEVIYGLFNEKFRILQEETEQNKENFVKVFCPEYPAGSIKVHCSGCSTFSRDQENIYKIGVNNKAKNIIISV